MLSPIVSLLGLSPSTNLYLSKATAHCANATPETCSYTLYINHDTDNPGVLPVLRYGFLSGKPGWPAPPASFADPTLQTVQ